MQGYPSIRPPVICHNPESSTHVQGEVLAWELESSHLAQRNLRLPPPLLEAPLSSLAPHPDGTFFIGDECGNVWRLQVSLTQACDHMGSSILKPGIGPLARGSCTAPIGTPRSIYFGKVAEPIIS